MISTTQETPYFFSLLAFFDFFAFVFFTTISYFFKRSKHLLGYGAGGTSHTRPKQNYWKSKAI